MLGARKSPRSRQGGFILVGKGRAMLGGKPRPTLDLSFLSDSIDSRLTTSGGAGGTRVNSAGVIVSASCPRIDYDPVTLACRGLLVEEQRTNLLLWSDDISNAAWSKFTATVTAGQAVSPDGGMNAAKLVANSGSPGYVVQGVAHTSGTTYTQGVFVKAAGRTVFSVIAQAGLFSDATPRSFLYTLTGNGSVALGSGSGATATITPVGSGWYFCTLTYTPSVSLTNGVQLRDSTAGDGVSGFYVWGADIQVGAFATSHIPTTTAAVTRTADSITMPFVPGASGTVYIEHDRAVDAGVAQHVFNFYNAGVGTNLIRAYYAATDALAVDVVTGGVSQAFLSTLAGAGINTVYKTAVAFSANDFAATTNGAPVVTDSSGSLGAMDTLAIGSANGSSGSLNGHVRRLRYYPTRLPNAQLQSMTTP